LKYFCRVSGGRFPAGDYRYAENSGNIKLIAVIKKKPAANQRFSAGPCPLRHIGNIVIWEGNYTSDIFNIGWSIFFLEKNSLGFGK
jgi:hypothetical protein